MSGIIFYSAFQKDFIFFFFVEKLSFLYDYKRSGINITLTGNKKKALKILNDRKD